MNSMFEQILNLLNSETGSLAYHLVLSFSIIAALALAQSQWEHNQSPRRKRVLIGLMLLLGMQLLLFFIAGLTWQGLFSDETLIPPLDRGVTMISLLLIVWLWAFPLPSSSADMLTLLAFFLILIASVMGILWWSRQGSDIFYNGSLPDILAQIGSLIIILTGCLCLFLHKPEGWQMGMSSLLLLLAGPIAYLILSPSGENYPSIIRLTQMAAFPFLLFLPQNIVADSILTIPNGFIQTEILEQGKISKKESIQLFETILWQSLLQLSSQTEPKKVEKAVVATAAKAVQSDICLLIKPPDKDGVIELPSGYNLTQNRYIEPISLESKSIPIFLSTFKMGRARRISAESDSPDSKELARILNLEKTGNILIVPVLSPDGKPLMSFVLLSPYTGRNWSSEELSFLGILTKVLVQYLKRCQEIDVLKKEVQYLKQSIRLANEQARQALDESQKLKDKLVVLEEGKQRDEAQIANLTVLAVAQEGDQESIGDSKEYGESLKGILYGEGHDIEEEKGTFGGELRLALEEVAYLNTALEQAEKKISDLQESQIEKSLSFASVIRPPLSSIEEHTNSLLIEIAGILGTRQRNHLEKIKSSTESIAEIVDDLAQEEPSISNSSPKENQNDNGYT